MLLRKNPSSLALAKAAEEPALSFSPRGRRCRPRQRPADEGDQNAAHPGHYPLV